MAKGKYHDMEDTGKMRDFPLKYDVSKNHTEWDRETG